MSRRTSTRRQRIRITCVLKVKQWMRDTRKNVPGIGGDWRWWDRKTNKHLLCLLGNDQSIISRRYIAICKRKQPVVEEKLRERLVEMYVDLRKDARTNKVFSFHLIDDVFPISGHSCYVLSWIPDVHTFIANTLEKSTCRFHEMCVFVAHLYYLRTVNSSMEKFIGSAACCLWNRMMRT